MAEEANQTEEKKADKQGLKTVEGKPDPFLKVFNLYEFRVFNPQFKECLTGSEMMVLMYILQRKLIYIRVDPVYWNGNTVKTPHEFKEELKEKFGIGQSLYEKLMTKLVKGGVFFRISKDYYAVNPYCFARGEYVHIVRKMKIFRASTVNLKAEDSPFLKTADQYQADRKKLKEDSKKKKQPEEQETEEAAPKQTEADPQTEDTPDTQTPQKKQRKRPTDRFF